MSRKIVVYEHEYLTDPEIIKHIQQNRSLQKYFTSDFSGIKTSSFCGSLKVDENELLILPKISKYKKQNLKVFMYMILYSYDIKSVDNFQNSEDMIEVFIEIFSKNLLKLINQTGLYKEYISIQNENSFLKGKLILKNYILNNGVNNKFFCEYDEFSINHKLNQFFIYTIKRLKVFSKNRANFTKLEKIFSEVDSVYNEDIDFNHLNIRFKESYDLAKFLLKNLTKVKVKKSKTFSFMFNMDILYENFVGKLFQDVANAKLQQIRFFGNLKLEPDIVLNNLIIDLKYKIFKQDVKKDDKYQIYIYANNFEIPNGMLLYPKHLGDFKKELKLGSNQHKVNLTVQSLDLNSDLDYKDYIKEMKTRVKYILKDF